VFFSPKKLKSSRKSIQNMMLMLKGSSKVGVQNLS